MVWKGQPSKASSCHYWGLIDEVITESRSPQHVTDLPYVWDLLLAQHRHWYKGLPNQHLHIYGLWHTFCISFLANKLTTMTTNHGTKIIVTTWKFLNFFMMLRTIATGTPNHFDIVLWPFSCLWVFTMHIQMSQLCYLSFCYNKCSVQRLRNVNEVKLNI